jgi:outer membrane lipoprotein-sorting protein
MQILLTLSVALTLLATPAFASPPEVSTIVQRMKAAFEPEQANTRTVTITVSGPNNSQVSWVAQQARMQQADGKRTLLVMEQPEDLRGNALLIWERVDQPNTMWWYPPALRRVRQLLPVEVYQRFFDTDLTYADLGYVDRQGNYRLLGEENRHGVQTYAVELVPAQQVYYSRIVTWVAEDTMLPVEREYYDVAGLLWKRMTFEQVTTIDDIPTPLHIRMQDLQQNTRTDVTFSNVRYGVELPPTLFDPQQLPQTVEARGWRPTDGSVS